MALGTEKRLVVAAGIVGVAMLIALLVLFGPSPASARQACGTYKSDSIYPRAKVIAIRGVGCHRARHVAKRFDHTGNAPGHWRCGLHHGGGRRLFTCGRGGHSGSLEDRPHALKAKGVGQPS